MKYGQNFEKESVPEWSLHNIDYNSLKHHIKVHTTRDQASAIAIPGHQDTALSRFEDELFRELTRQHDRVDLFVSSKASELSRRLQYTSKQIQRLVPRCPSSRDPVSPKRQRRFVKYEQELERCGDDIQALARFVNAQVIAFRKILKKYRKWTGSAALGSRFKDGVLSDPKSFTKRDFSYLQSQCDNLLATLRAATPANLSGAATPDEQTASGSPGNRRPELCTTNVTQHQRDSDLQLPEPAVAPPQGYWNEYDHGSEAGDIDRNDDAVYTIYVDPSEDANFPGMATLAAIFRVPLEKTRSWLSQHHSRTSSSASSANHDNANTSTGERAPLLLPGDTTAYGGTNAPASTFTSPTVNSSSYVPSPNFLGPSSLATNTDDDQPTSTSHSNRHKCQRRTSSTWSDDYGFPSGYATHYAAPGSLPLLPSIESQRSHARFRDRVLILGTIASFAASAVFLTVAAVLILTGRHKLRAEVDAGATIGVCASLACACGALAMNMNRTAGGRGWVNWLLVGGAFTGVCFVNGVLLVLVVGNTEM